MLANRQILKQIIIWTDELEEDLGDNFHVLSYEYDNKISSHKRLNQKFEFEIENLLSDKSIYINPFVIKLESILQSLRIDYL